MRPPDASHHSRVDRSVAGVAVPAATLSVVPPVASAAHPSVSDLPFAAPVCVDPATAVVAAFAVPPVCLQASAAGPANPASAVVVLSAVGRPSSDPASCPAGSADFVAAAVVVFSVLRASSPRNRD